jgi:hypothetical protein
MRDLDLSTILTNTPSLLSTETRDGDSDSRVEMFYPRRHPHWKAALVI